MPRAEEALAALLAEPDSPDRGRRLLEQALVFARATFAAVYTPGEDGELLCLADSAGVPRSLYGLRDGYRRAGNSPVADAHHSGRPVWLGPGSRPAAWRPAAPPRRTSRWPRCPPGTTAAPAACSP
ncbi:hypothetical protein GCM10020295_73760 [Streptomyces cinereospinus]